LGGHKSIRRAEKDSDPGLLPLIITRRSGITGYLKLRVFGAALNNDNIHFVVCHSQNELLHYKALRSLTTVAGKIRYAPFGSTSLRQEVRADGSYIFPVEQAIEIMPL